MTVNLVHTDLLDTIAVLRRVADSLDAERRSTDRQVDVLLDGGWSGRAARDYVEGWEQWRSGCDEVLAALHAMAEMVGHAHREMLEQDDATRADLAALADDLLTRLGGAA